MEGNRIVVEFFFEKPNFEEVSKIAEVLKQDGINAILLPPDDRGINTHCMIELSEVEKTRKKLEEIGVNAREKEVILIRLENRPGTMAEAAKKISEKGVNLTYAFSVTLSPEESYVLLGADDNKAALEALNS